ncbi:hypothetical protein ACFV2L_00600 [Streptomyces sp. NPDC059687]|uniref:hypothetical protein n=1 Tax=unclassified Streptomyces TaxID=2593676 RepID=UPI0033B34618
MELDRHGAELLFQVLTEPEEKNSGAIASNESFGRLDQDLHRSPAPAPGPELRSPPRPADLCRRLAERLGRPRLAAQQIKAAAKP